MYFFLLTLLLYLVNSGIFVLVYLLAQCGVILVTLTLILTVLSN